MRKTYHWNERAAVAEFHGGYSRQRAEAIADECTGLCTKDQLPDAWNRANAHWRAVVASTYGQRHMRREHKRLKQQHDAASFNDLTIGQIIDDVHAIRPGS